MKIEVTTANKIDDEIRQKLKDIFGENVEIVEKIDENVFGGIRIRKDNELFDGTVKGQLDLLKNKIVSL